MRQAIAESAGSGEKKMAPRRGSPGGLERDTSRGKREYN